MQNQTETSTALVKTYPCDLALRAQVLALVEDGITQSAIARGANLNPAVLSSYLSDAGNRYDGDTAKMERKLAAWLQKRDLETLAGIPTIESPICKRLATAARMVQRAHFMGKAIGRAGMGKTRGAVWLKQQDDTVILILASKEGGDLESVRDNIFRQAGIRGGHLPKQLRSKNPEVEARRIERWARSRARRREMYKALVKWLRGTETLIVIDQAQMLSSASIWWLTELWNATRSPQLWIGPEDLATKLERNEQWASRMEFTAPLEMDPKEDAASIRDMVRHQIESLLPDLNGQMKPLLNLCTDLAVASNFRRVEARLLTMLYLSESPENKSATWPELFEQSAQFLTGQD